MLELGSCALFEGRSRALYVITVGRRRLMLFKVDLCRVGPGCMGSVVRASSLCNVLFHPSTLSSHGMHVEPALCVTGTCMKRSTRRGTPSVMLHICRCLCASSD